MCVANSCMFEYDKTEKAHNQQNSADCRGFFIFGKHKLLINKITPF